MALDPTLLADISELYGVSPDALHPATGGHFSHVFEYSAHGQACILRITPPNTDVDRHAMQAILEWLAFLAEQGGPVVRPLRSLSGSLIEAVAFAEQTYLAVAFEKAPGVLAEGMSPGEWSDELIQALGCTVGHCHRLAQQYFPARPELKRPQWDSGTSCFNPKEALVDADRLILEKRTQVLNHIQALPKEVESYGLAHLDLHFGNFFVDIPHQKIVLFDFDDCAYGWYIMDLAMLLFDVLVVYDGADRREFGERFLLNLLRGYITQVQVSSFWISQLPHFLKLLEIGLYAMLYREYDTSTADWWVSRFMPGRRERIEQDLPYVELDFEVIFNRVLSFGG